MELGIEGLTDLEQIGRGGSARVFRARQPELDRWVAVKVLHSSWDEGVQRRFERERKAMGRLSDHDGIVPIFATGTTMQGEPYILMPFYEAGSLAEKLDTTRPFGWREASALIASVAETLGMAHSAGIVHRDVKPANILIGSSGEPKIADFGISRLSSAETASQSTDLTFTPVFAPPESFVTATATPSADVYGAAATLFALLAGRPPFTGDGLPTDVISVIHRVANNPVEDLRSHVPDAICAVIERGMAKEPVDRPVDGLAFLAELRMAIAAVEDQSTAATLLVGAPQADAVDAGAPAAGLVDAVDPSAMTFLGGRDPLANVPDDPEFASRSTFHGIVPPAGGVFAQDGPPQDCGGNDATRAAAIPSGVHPRVQATPDSRPWQLLIGAGAVVLALLVAAGAAFTILRNAGDDAGVEVAGATQSAFTDVDPNSSPQGAADTTTMLIGETVLAEETVADDELGEELSAELDRTPSPSSPPSVAEPRSGNGVGVSSGGSGAPDQSAPATTVATAPAPQIAGITLVRVDDSSAQLRVSTTQCSALTYSVDGVVQTINATNCAVVHLVTLRRLSASTSYRFIAVATGEGGRSSGSSVTIRTTAEPLAPTTTGGSFDATEQAGPEIPETTSPSNSSGTQVIDFDPDPSSTAPTVSGLAVSAITSTTAKVTYSGSECTGTSYTISGIASGASGYPNRQRCWDNHQLLLGRQSFGGELSPGTTYTVTVVVISESGARSPARSVRFTTTPAAEAEPQLVIGGASTSGISRTGARVSFTTNVCAGSSFSVNGTVVHSDGYPKNNQCWNSHARSFTDLAPGTNYSVKVVASTRAGQTVSRTISFTTDPAPLPPVPDPPTPDGADPVPAPVPDPPPVGTDPVPAPPPPVPDPPAPDSAEPVADPIESPVSDVLVPDPIVSGPVDSEL